MGCVLQGITAGSPIICEDESLYDFSNPLIVNGRTDTLLQRLVGTRAFQRLRSIRFLGAIDYILVRSPNGELSNTRHTRYQHSLGVARLAMFYCSRVQPSLARRREIAVSALLHDIGHAPLSHTVEKLFKNEVGLDHHEASAAIIKGEVPIGREVHQILKSYKIDIERILELISGSSLDHHGFFGGPINFDTIEAILRSHTYAVRFETNPRPESIVEASLNRENSIDRLRVDEFWNRKDQIYRHLIHSRVGVLADAVCDVFLRRRLRQISVADFYISEQRFFRKFPGLLELLSSPFFEADASTIIDKNVTYTARRFSVREASDFFKRDDRNRYEQTKLKRLMSAPEAHNLFYESEGDLFGYVDRSHRARKKLLKRKVGRASGCAEVRSS